VRWQVQMAQQARWLPGLPQAEVPGAHSEQVKRERVPVLEEPVQEASS
jgi:hypothetical protein